MAKLSKAHQSAVDCLRYEQRQSLAYHHILRAIVTGSGKWGNLKRVGSIYDRGDSYVWQLTLSPRLRDGVILETFTNRDGDVMIRCYFLADLSNLKSDSQFTTLYWKAVEMERQARDAENEEAAANRYCPMVIGTMAVALPEPR